MPLHIETHHDERTVVLSCETCELTVPVRTLDDDFVRDIQAFFDAHADCARTLDLTD